MNGGTIVKFKSLLDRWKKDPPPVLTARENVATPVNWKPGDDVIIPASVSDEAAKQKYPQGFKTHKPYLRTTKQPAYALCVARDGR